MKGYLIIPIWLLGNVATTLFLILTFIMSKVKKSKAGEPYFRIRSIASVANNFSNETIHKEA